MWFLSTAAAQVVELPEEDALVSVRLRSLGGAATGLAESASADFENPAAIAIRRSPADEQRFDPDVTLQARDHPLLASVFGHPGAPWRSSYVQLAGNLRASRTGVGVGWRETRVASREGDDVGTFTASAGAGFSAGTWAVGVLPHLFGVQESGGGMAIGGGATAGVLVAPPGSFRVGASARPPMRTGALESGLRARSPLEAQLGASWSPGLPNEAGRWGPQRSRSDGPVAAIVTAELVVTGGSAGAVVLAEGDLDPEASPTTVSPRGGAEAWLLDDRLRVRGGAGWIPGRGGTVSEPYGSGGAAVQLFSDPRGFGWRAVVGGEWYAESGPAVGIGLETW